jgi:uncharacterized protein (TIGR02569 family)
VHPPPTEVLQAFAAEVDPAPLPGGRGTSWRAGAIVLKPANSPSQGEELAALVAGLPEDGFRVARPLGAIDGRFVVSGWSAWRWVEGRHADDRWEEMVALSERLGRVLADRPRPAFLEQLHDPWVRAGHVAFGRTPVDPYRHRADVAALLPVLRPIAETTSQLIHNDLAGNVLFDDPRPPAVIDFTPGWRPAGYQTAVVVADAFLWHDAGAALADQAAPRVDGFGQLFARAILFRLVVDAIFRPGDPGCTFLPAVERATRWLAGKAV